LLLWGLVIVLLVYIVVRLFRPGTNQAVSASRDRDDSLTILKRRLARGEISTAEYAKMKQVLSQP
jgi:uncharacterized membrane protein